MATHTLFRRPSWKTRGFVLLAAVVAIPMGALGAAEPEQRREVDRLATARVLTGFGGSHIGVSVRDVEDLDADDAAVSEGAVVDDIRRDSPAADAGLEEGDVIVEFDGERVRSARQLARLVAETPAGRSVATSIVRAGERMELSVTPERGPDLLSAALEGSLGDVRRLRELRVAPAIPEWSDRGFDFRFFPRPGRLGVGVEAVSGQLADYFGVDAGVLVTSVRQDSVAAAAGLRAGDVITAVDGRTVDDVGALQRRLDGVGPGESFTITLMRDRTEMSLTATLEEADAPARPGRRARTI